MLAPCVVRPAMAGPPFLTDDPTPIGYRHKEVYLFSTYDEASEGTTLQGPAAEFNYGFAPNLMVHVVVPYTMFYPDMGVIGRGLGDIELGMMYQFVQESATTPAVGTFPFIELPAGNASRGTGNGQAWYRVPVWAAKSFGSWRINWGGGYVINHAPGARNYGFGGVLLRRTVNSKVTLGGEIFSQQAGAVGGAGSTFVTFGGYYAMAFCDCQLLFDIGHTVAGESHAVGYLGLYWTWGPSARN